MKLHWVVGAAVLLVGALYLGFERKRSAPENEGIIEIYSSDVERRDGREVLVLHEPPIVLRIPEKFRSWDGSMKTHAGINLITYYPSFMSGSDPENRPYRIGSGCTGWCNGQLMIAIENARPTPKTIYSANHADLMGIITFQKRLPRDYKLFDPIKHNYNEPMNGDARTLYAVTSGPMHGFDQSFYVILQKNINQARSADDLFDLTREIYLAHTSPDTHRYDLFAECEKRNSYPGCKVYFSLRCSPDVGIEVLVWPWDRVDELFELQRRVDRFVSEMVVAPNYAVTGDLQ